MSFTDIVNNALICYHDYSEISLFLSNKTNDEI